MYREKSVLILIIILLIGLNCSENPAGNDSDKGTLKISLTDAPADYDAVNITFSEVSANRDNQWEMVSTKTQQHNLLSLQNGVTSLLGESQLEPGTYNQIRLKISEAEVVYNGETYPLNVPSGAQSGLKLGPSFTLQAGYEFELVVDFDVNKSVVPRGPRHRYTGFQLKPRVRVMARNSTGSITGQVTNYENLPVAHAIAGFDTVTTTIVNDTDGSFILSFLPEGSYTVSVVDTTGLSYSQSEISVTASQSADIGQITLE